MFQLTPAAKNILIINGIIYILSDFIGLRSYIIENFGMRYFHSENFQPYQILTYMWVHGGFGHLFGNMFSVLVFAPILERVWGSKKFLIYYLITGIGAGILYSGINYYENYSFEIKVKSYEENPSPESFRKLVLNNSSEYYNQLYDFIDSYEQNPSNSNDNLSIAYANDLLKVKSDVPMVGASGAVFGILLAFAMLFPNMELMLLFFPIPVKAKYVVLVYGIYELWSEINRMPGDNVAHFAHLGGMLIGYLILKYWKRKYGTFY
ncbi:MAG: rhomboid family intramembrane serine protease [Bacteroidota bacterium]|nr:rhomboid family intramembrane serine protease [Bacteroidota bacterium]